MRAKILQVTPELFVEMCKPTPSWAGWHCSKNSIPEDARIERVEIRETKGMRGEIRITLSSKEWPEAGDGPYHAIYPLPMFELMR